MSDVRHALADFLEVVDAAHFQVVTGDGDDRDRNLLEILLTARRRDHDLLETFLSESGLIVRPPALVSAATTATWILLTFMSTPNWIPFIGLDVVATAAPKLATGLRNTRLKQNIESSRFVSAESAKKARPGSTAPLVVFAPTVIRNTNQFDEDSLEFPPHIAMLD